MFFPKKHAEGSTEVAEGMGGMSEHHRTPRKEEDDGVGKSLDEEDALEKFATRIEKIGKGVIKLGKRVGRHSQRHAQRPKKSRGRQQRKNGRTHRTDDTYGRTTG